MIAQREINRQRIEWLKLVLYEILPGIVFVIDDIRFWVQLLIVRVKIVNGAIVAQVPIEFGAVAFCALRDRRHHDVAAIAGIPGNGKGPRGCAA